MKHPITTTRNGIPVYVDLIKSPAGTNISQQPHLVTLIKEFLPRSNVTKAKMSIEYDFGRNIGNCEVIETGGKDQIVYAKHVKRDNYIRFVRRKFPKPSTYITVLLERDADGEYALTETWIGQRMPPFPGTTEETEESRTYWENHAFVLEGQPIQFRSMTTTCPY